MISTDQKKKKILLVEDDFMIAMLQIRILTDNDYQVIHVNTGEKAIETVESEETIDLVLMDINLGMGMDGTEAAVVILQNYDIPLVFLSSHTEPEIVEKTEGITSYGYIVKDSGETVLLASLKMAFKLYESIKKEKLKEQALQKSEFRYYSLFDNISSGVAIYEAVDDGADFVIRDFNRTSEIMTDTHREDVLNKKVTEVFPGVRDFGLFEAFVRVWKTGIPETLPAAHYEDKRLTRFYSNYVYRLSSGEIVAVYNDHTEKKQIEEALNESEFHFRTLADSGQGLIWASGTDMKCTYFNKVWLEFTGRTLEEEIGDGWTEGLHPDDKEYCINVYVNAFEKQEPFGMEYRIKHKDGDYRWIYDKGTPRYNHKGDFIGYIGHCLDINDRKKVEYDLINARLRAEESEERFKALHNASFGGIVIHDKGRIIECNQGLSEITGYNYEELIGMDGLLLIAESDRHIVMSNILSGYEKPYEVMGIRKNGEVYPVRLEARNIPYKGKKVRTVEFRDISGQIKIEQELRESEKRYRILFEKITSGFALHEMIYDENGKAIDYRFLEVNPAFEKLTGLKAIDLVGKSVKEVIPGIEQYWIETYAEVVKTGKDKIFENYIKEMNKYYEVSAFSPAENQFAVTSTDISERKFKEKKIKELLKEKELILREVHHRIKNNMNTIFSLLMIQAHDQDNPTVKQILTESANRLQSMKVLYDKLFRYESYTELNLRIFIPQLLKDILGTFHSDTPVISSVELDDINLPSEYLAPLGLIINELVSNSFKYGFYSLKEKHINLSASFKDQRILMKYSDNGPGLPKDFSIEQSPGFGMQLIKMLTEQLNGHFNYKTCKQAEFCFEFKIP